MYTIKYYSAKKNEIICDGMVRPKGYFAKQN